MRGDVVYCGMFVNVGLPGEAMQRIELQIIDDPANARVYKGPGHYAATRALKVIRRIETAFPQLRFDSANDCRLDSLNAVAMFAGQIESVEFIAVLADALDSTGTRIAPLAR
jgi:hypothetical protein